MIEDFKMQNDQIEEQTKKTERKIRQKAQHGRSLGQKNTKKLMKKHFDKQLREALYRWRDSIKNLQNLEGGASVILKKIRKRLLRMALNRFKEGVNYKEQEDRNENRKCEIQEKLHFRIKRRLYNAMKSYGKKMR